MSKPVAGVAEEGKELVGARRGSRLDVREEPAGEDAAAQDGEHAHGALDPARLLAGFFLFLACSIFLRKFECIDEREFKGSVQKFIKTAWLWSLGNRFRWWVTSAKFGWSLDWQHKTLFVINRYFGVSSFYDCTASS